MRNATLSLVVARVVARVVVFVAAAASCPAATSQPATQAAAPAGVSRDASLRALAGRLDLPLVEDAVAIFSKQLRRTLPPYFVDAVGQGANLGPQWKRGNPWFDQALRRVDAALAAEEARGGPLLRVDRADLLAAVNIPWSADDIAFVNATIETELGREAQRALDAKGAMQVTNTLRRRVAAGAGGLGIVAAFDELDARARAQFGDASLMLLALRGTDPDRAGRLQRLVESVTAAPSDALGKRLVDRLSQRLLDAATAQVPTVIEIIAGFRTGP